MSKVKSFQLLFAAVFSLVIFACGDSGNVTSNSEAPSEEVQAIEAQVEELQEVEADIETKIDELDAALNELDN